MSRSAAHAQEMIQWMAPLFADENAELRRIRQAVCLFSDIGWRLHPDDRAIGTYNQVLHAPFAGADHRARALIASAVFHRYSGDEEVPKALVIEDLLDKDDEMLALRIGLTARLAFAMSASAVGELSHTKLRLTPGKAAARCAAAPRDAGRRAGVETPWNARRVDGPQGRNPDRIAGVNPEKA